jgi:DNA-binding transcriptional regulator YdaS (Cro superfamily)
MQIAKARTQAHRAMRLLRDEPGLLARIARALNVNPQAVSQWRMVPLERLLVVERLSGIPREQLRPDVGMIWTEPRTEAKERKQRRRA